MPHQCTNCGHVFADGSKEMLSGCPDCGGNKFQYHPGDIPDEEPPADAEPPEQEGGSVTSAVGRAANRVRDAVTSDPSQPAARTSPDEPSTNDVDPDAVTAESSGIELGDSDPAAGETAGDAGDEQVSSAESASGAEPATGSEASPGASTPPGADTTRRSDTAPGADPDPSTNSSLGADPGADAQTGVDADMAEEEDTAQADARSEVVDRNSLPDAPSEGRVVKEPDEPENRPDLEDLRSELNDQFESIRIVAPGQYELNLMELYDRQEYIIALQEDGQYVIEVPDAWETDDE
ncbi:OapC/ArvC family zinc-ribbon domain-containing protein [Halobacterium bonnevillei]|uniref:Origin-associated protein OapC n=1 Tax=Halobacterium bonnevillei TaxID=2692200 RepID=A0A6B0SF99_9EURY|nr:Zn-ribbon containing protein [Halobacterium bonnevillei]MXR20444.1 hypothetical protein [Halobacterium bonnevillei]